MSTRTIVITCLVAAALAAIFVFARSAEAPSSNSDSEATRPNFVIFIADDVSWNDIQPYSDTAAKTPNILQLANVGMRFDNMFLTTSSCTPSRGSILTGLYPSQSGSKHLHQGLEARHVTLASMLREQGYYTAVAGKAGIGAMGARQFDIAVDDPDDSSGAALWTDVVRGRPMDKPFFFFFASRDPHRPFDTSGENLPPPIDPDTIEPPAPYVNRPATRKRFSEYYRELQRFDVYVGKVIEALKQQGVMDNTIIMVMSDNGRPFMLSKLTLYNEGLRAPFIMHWPNKIPAGTSSGSLLSAIDIVPTVLEVANINQPDYLPGQSFRSLFDAPDLEVRDHIFAERNWHGKNAHERAVRNTSYLYKENQYPEHGECISSQAVNRAEIKDIKAAFDASNMPARFVDCFSEQRAPRELYAINQNGDVDFDNLIDNPDHQEAQADLTQRLSDWRRAVSDTDYQPYAGEDR
ncbi:MAG: sulfatase [Pseudomonadota bacterium]